MRRRGWAALLGALVIAPATGCDWREVDKDAETTPVLSIGTPGNFGTRDDFGRIVVPIDAPSETDGVSGRFLVSGVTGTGLALVELSASGRATTTNVASPVFNGPSGTQGFPLNAIAEIPGPRPGQILVGASHVMDGSSVIYTVSLGGTHEGKVFVATLTKEADPYLGLGVAVGNFHVGDPDLPEYVLASADVVRVYVDGKTPAMWSWDDVTNGPACPVSLPGDHSDARDVPTMRPILVGHFWGDGSDAQIAVPNFSSFVSTGKGSVSFFGVTAMGLSCLGTINGVEPAFGQSLAAGDFNADLKSDLLVGAPPGGAYVFIGPLGPTSTGIALQGDAGAVRFGASVAAFNLDGAGKADQAIVGDPEAAVSGDLAAGTAQLFSFEGTGPTPTAKKGRLLAAHDPSANAGYGAAVAGVGFCGTCPTGTSPRLPAVGAGSRVLTYFTLGTDLRKLR